MAALGDGDTLCDQARALMRERKYADALVLYEQVISKDQRSLPAFEGAAAAAFALKNFDRAIELFKRLSVLDIRRAEPLINLGAVYNRQGDFASAARTLRQALTKDRKSAPGYYNLGIAYKGQNQQSMAVSAYKEAIKLDPKMPEAHQNLGNLYVEMGNLNQAMLEYEKALAIDPKFEKSRRSMEKAQAAIEDAKRKQNPFGRLVNEEEVASRKMTEYRELTSQERFDDRQVLHQLAKEAEHLATAMVTQLREELGPAILKMAQASAQSGELRALYREFQQATPAANRFTALAAALREKSDVVRKHELTNRKPG